MSLDVTFGTAEGLRRVGFGSGTVSIVLWVQYINNWSGLINMDNAANPLFAGINPTPQFYLDVNGNIDQGGTVSFNQWYGVTFVRDTAPATNTHLMTHYNEDGSQADQRSLDNNVAVGTDLSIGESQSFTAFGHNARMGAIKVWQAALTQAELRNELAYFAPLRTDNLFAWSACIDDNVTDCALDLSGNGNDWTVIGTMDILDNPPIMWAPASSMMGIAAAAVSAWPAWKKSAKSKLYLRR